MSMLAPTVRPNHVGPVFRRQLCTKPLFLPADKGNKLKHIQGFAQIQCPGRAGVEDRKAERGEVRSPPTRSPVGCWRAQPLWPHNKSQFSSPSPFTQSLLCTPSGLPSPRQTQHCLVQGQLIFWAVSGGKDNDGSSGNSTTLRCHQVMCGKAQAGQRGLLLPTGREGNPGV